MDFYKYYKEWPTWAKGVFFIGSGLVVYIIGSNIYKAIKKQTELKGQRQAVDDSKKALGDLKSQGQIPSFPDGQYSTWCSAIQAAFGGCDPTNDDWASVMNAIDNILNEADIYKLISTFGVRKWDECGIFSGEVELDLVGGVRHELNQSQINIINEVLRKKGIQFRF